VRHLISNENDRRYGELLELNPGWYMWLVSNDAIDGVREEFIQAKLLDRRYVLSEK
jgi:hypothetical protein